jgi:leucine efflux protein
MNGIAHLPAFLLAATLIILIPGPAASSVAGRVRFSPCTGAMAALGIVAGDIILISIAGIGFTALVAMWPALQEVAKVCGGLYIAYLGLESLNSPASAGQRGAEAPRGGFARALAGSLSNPRPALFFAAFFPMFIDRAAPSTMGSFVTLGAMYEVLNVMYVATIITLMARLHRVHAVNAAAAQRWGAWGLLLCSALILIG